MKKQFIFAISIIVMFVAGGIFIAWQKGWLELAEGDTVVLREDLPPAPAGYKTLNENSTIASEIPENAKQEYKKALQEVLTTLEEHPDSFGAWFNLGAIKSIFGDYKGAEEVWLYATTISPNQARSLMNLGDLYWNKLKDYQKAEWAYLTAIERGDASVDPVMLYRDLASLYRYSYKEKQSFALQVLEQGIQNGGTENNSELLALAGMWAWEDGLFEKAADFYEQYLVLNPDQAEARKDLERIRRRERLP